MKILVLGGSGYIGARFCELLAGTGWATPVCASSRHAAEGVQNVRVDTTDPVAMSQAIKGMDAVINCVAGSARAISEGARVLADAAATADVTRIVHLSSMAVYGSREGAMQEKTRLDDSERLGWYARAKREAEGHIAAFAKAGGTAVILRPGCVWGPGSDLWVGRIGRYLQAGRLGDLGAAGDGWSNLVHVDDVCAAAMAALRMPLPLGQLRTYNLAAPDSPRWNRYFVDLALAIGATPVRRIGPLRLKMDAWVGGPPLKLAQQALVRAGRAPHALPDPLPPGLLGLWQRHLQLKSDPAQRDLDLQWIPYDRGLRQSAQWYLKAQRHAG